MNAENQSNTDSPDDSSIAEKAFLVLGGMIFPIEKDIFTIGRNIENDLVLNDPTVSRFHAEIRYSDSQFLIVDKNSSSGTFLNDKKITVNQLFAGDILQISHTPIMFMVEGSSLLDEGRKHTGELNQVDNQELDD